MTLHVGTDDAGCFSHLAECKALVLEDGHLAGARNALLVQLLAGLWPGVVILVADVLELDACILEEESGSRGKVHRQFSVSESGLSAGTNRMISPRPREPMSR